MSVKYPHLQMDLVGEDGNAFAIMGRLRSVLRRGKVPANEIEAVMRDMRSGNYDHLLRVCMDTVSCDSDDGVDD